MATICDQFNMCLRVKSSVEIERRDPEHPGRVEVGPPFVPLIDWVELIILAICRISLSMTSMIQTLILPRHYFKMIHRIRKSGLLLPTQMIPMCIHLLFVLGSLVSLSTSFSLVSISSFTSDTPSLRSPMLVFDYY
jgi:hypothetical protein